MNLDEEVQNLKFQGQVMSSQSPNPENHLQVQV